MAAVLPASVVEPAARLRGEPALPGDKSISHRALMFALLAAGESRIAAAGDGDDIRSTAEIARRLGATVEREREREGRVDYRVVSPGPDGLEAPEGPLDCGNSGTSMRLFAGILAGLALRTVLDGDASLRARPMARIIRPLRAMGAELRARQDDTLPPVAIAGRAPLSAVDWTMPVPSAQVKSAILLAGLRAEGRTVVRESICTRDHTERMLRARGVPVRTVVGDGGAVVAMDGGATVERIDERVPADLSAAAFWLVAGSIHPDADLTLRGVGLNPTRRACLDILRSMGATIEESGGERPEPLDDGVGEPVGDLRVRSSELRAVELGPADVAAAIDEIPILCLAAALARGTTRIRGAGELRHKESDRIAGIVAGLAALGAHIRVDGDDLTIEGRPGLRGAPTDSRHDHRLAMTFAIAGLVAAGRTTISRPASAAVSYPGFFDTLERIRA